jgi:hypothetical protein
MYLFVLDRFWTSPMRIRLCHGFQHFRDARVVDHFASVSRIWSFERIALVRASADKGL